MRTNEPEEHGQRPRKIISRSPYRRGDSILSKDQKRSGRVSYVGGFHIEVRWADGQYESILDSKISDVVFVPVNKFRRNKYDLV